MAARASPPDSLRLHRDEVHVWTVNLDVPSGTIARLSAYLASEEHERSARFRFERDRERFIVAHGVLRDLISRYLEVEPGQISYACNEFGKPDLSPKFGSRLNFNLSHSAGIALIAITADADVGIDVERIRTRFEYADFARFFFSAAENEYLMNLPRDHRTEAFFSCWTKKEAYLKACGKGLSISPDRFSVPLENDGVRTPIDLLVTSNDTHPDKRWSMYTLAPAPCYVGALAIEGGGRRLSQWPWIWTAPSWPNATLRRIPA